MNLRDVFPARRLDDSVPQVFNLRDGFEIMDYTSPMQTNSNGRSLPKGWQWVKLGDVCEINPRRPLLERADEALTTFVPMSSVDDLLGIIAKPESKLYSEIKRGYTYFAENDVIFAKITPCMENGKHAIARKLIDGIGFGSTEFHVIRPNENIIAEWIWYFVRQPYIRQNAKNYFTGAVGQQRVPDSFLKSLEIPLPPLDEQRRIANRLNEQLAIVECARKAAEEQLEAARQLPSAYLREVFESRQIRNAAKKPFGELVNNFDGKRIPVKLDDRNKRHGQYPYYGASGIIDAIDDYLFDGEYLLIGEDGANLLFRSTPIAFRAIGKFWVNNHAHVVQPKPSVLFDYLLHFFAITDLKPYVTGAAQPKLTQDAMNSILVPVPILEIQEWAVSHLNYYLDKVEGMQRTLESQLAEIERLPASLLREAFTGGV